MATKEIKRPDLEFELPIKKNTEGFYTVFPNQNYIGGKNSLRNLAAKKVNIGYIYLINIVGTDKCKIGVSTNPKRRLSDISNYIPFELKVLAINKIKNPYVFEQEIINTYKNKLIKNEWFELTDEEKANIMIDLHNKQVEEYEQSTN
jgi:hypothetical protein